MIEVINELFPIHLTVLRLYCDRLFQDNGGSLRLAITGALPDRPLLHHHKEDGSSDYSLSEIRYLVIDGIPHIVTFGKGRGVLDEVSRLKLLRVRHVEYKVSGFDFIEDGIIIGVSNQLRTYASITPWLALNQENAAKFRCSRGVARKDLLNSILVGNCLSLLKGLNIRICSRIMTEIVEYHSARVQMEVSMMGFHIRFVSNFAIPEFLGLGKMPSKGFGLMRLAGNSK